MELSKLQSEIVRTVKIAFGAETLEVDVAVPNRQDLQRHFRQCSVKDKRTGETVLQLDRLYPILAGSCIKDVRGITQDGKAVSYTPEIGVALLNLTGVGNQIEDALYGGAEWLEEKN